jgi:hypothetical protein
MKTKSALSPDNTGSATFPESTADVRSVTDTLWSRFREAFSKVTIHRHPRRLRICETLSLGEKRLLAVVECDHQQFLIAATSHNIALLQTLASKKEEHNPEL